MKIKDINVSVFELPNQTPLFDLINPEFNKNRWQKKIINKSSTAFYHVLHVKTNEGIEGICTVGDVRYTTLTKDILEWLKILTINNNPLERDKLFHKLQFATRQMYLPQGWFGAFDNCLWDIAGKTANLPVYQLIGEVRKETPVYYNIAGEDYKTLIQDTHLGLSKGFTAIKDHFHGDLKTNIQWLKGIRKETGSKIDLMHDAGRALYDFDEALIIGKVLEELKFRWFEEPINDREQSLLKKLCKELSIPVLNPESMMNDLTLCAEWLISGSTDLLRVNARHGTTHVLKLADLAEAQGTTVEFNGPGGLFGLLHANLLRSIRNTSYYEYFPDGTRDAMGKEIGLLNPAIPEKGFITSSDQPGWGSEWDWKYFNKKRITQL